MHVALVRFKEAGKKYYFSYQDLDLSENDSVVVETARGVEVGTVHTFKDIEETDLTSELKPILRKASDEDIETEAFNRSLEPSIVEKTKTLAKKNKLEMKVLGAEYTLDRKRLMIYFEAESRVDFRTLVKDLSDVYHTRIELRQVGPRDAAKMIGGIGPCGLVLCCNTFIGEFEPVSIKMAKNQNISLNPQKISGVCGKLLCCIRYEDKIYQELKKTLPDLNETVTTEKGSGRVVELNIIAQKVRIKFQDDHSLTWVPLSDLVTVEDQS
ncbi:MAG: stage 0 sporulation family protein [Acholeplasmataceae bacterium]|nr:stage 0 sporulation family protein [Acholeplasmataceae bacterium]